MATSIIGRYADVRIDLAFKKCFGTEQHKAATIGLINAMIPGIGITDVSFAPTELPGLSTEDRKGVIDVLCTSADGGNFIVEMQRAPQLFFRERTLYYSSLYLLNQAKRGDWDFHLRSSYVIAFLDFPMEKMGVKVGSGDIPMVSYITSDPKTGAKMPGSTEYWFFDLESFVKKESEIADNREKWLFLLRNSGSLTRRPERIKGPEFDEFFTAAEIAGFNKDERIKYETDMMTQRDIHNALAFAKQEGLQEGLQKGEAKGIAKGIATEQANSETRLRQTAANLKEMGLAASEISKATGLPEDVVRAL